MTETSFSQIGSFAPCFALSVKHENRLLGLVSCRVLSSSSQVNFLLLVDHDCEVKLICGVYVQFFWLPSQLVIPTEPERPDVTLNSCVKKGFEHIKSLVNLNDL